MSDIAVSTLDKKIEDLFQYRRFQELYEIAGVKQEVTARIHQDLKSLQYAIYMLDKHLEEHWQLDEATMEQRWEDIYEGFANFGISRDLAPEYCKHIQRYERHERQLRSYILPSKYKMQYFYFYKSCDVKLMRRLIFEQLPQLKSLFQLSEWRWFDLITEINDDVEDVFEDLEYINGNSFLINLILHGKSQTKLVFEDFITEIEQANEATNNHQRRWSNRIYEMTKENIALTRALLIKNLDTFDTEVAEKSVLFTYLKHKP